MFSSTFTTFFLAAMAATLVRSAPTPALDAATLLKNGQAAQKLNTLFQTIKDADPCTNEDKACISSGVAVCVKGQWKTSGGQCSTSQQCFALPSVREAGTLVTCTSEKSALSAIEASGASGGIFGAAGGNSTSAADNDNNGGGNATSTTISVTATSSSAADKSIQTVLPNNNGDNDEGRDMEFEDQDSSDSKTAAPATATSSSASESTRVSTLASEKSADSTSTSSPDNDAGPVTVTVTLTAQPTTFAPQTRTLSPDDASSVLSSLMANGATIIVSPSSAGSVDAKEPAITTAPTAQPSETNQPAPTTVPLTAAPSVSAVSSGGYDY